MEQKDIVIIGAGLTGLTTAFYLKKAGVNFHVIERMDRPGGVISTASENGFTYENGPNTGVVGTAEVVDLFADLQGLCDLETPGDSVNKRYILKNGKWEKLPSGLWEGIKTPLFATKDKFRLLLEPFRKKGNNPHETLAELVVRRMGKSFLDYAVDPFIMGVYAGDPSLLVTRYALPKLYNLEQEYGSFIKGGFKKGFEKKDEQAKKITRKVFSAKGGLGNLTNAMYQSIGEGNFSFNMNDVQISHESGVFVIRANQNNQPVEISANQVITTTGAHELNTMLPFVDQNKIQKITNLKYARVVEVVLGFKKWNGFPLEGFGGLIPFKENRNVLGYLFLSSFLENKAPDGGALITIFIGGIRKSELTHLPDVELMKLVEKETVDLMQLKEFNPDLVKINRYNHAIPQYGVESGARFETIEELQVEFPGLIIGGNLRNGIGMADRIKQGKELAIHAIKNSMTEKNN